MKTAFETNKFEHEKFVSDLRDRHKVELRELAEENHSLQLRLEESRDQESIRQLRRELDEARRRLVEAGTEMAELRKARDD